MFHVKHTVSFHYTYEAAGENFRFKINVKLIIKSRFFGFLGAK